MQSDAVSDSCLQAVWKIDPRSIKLLAKVAEGAYGEVSQGLYGSFSCAVKMIRKELRDFDLNVHTQEFQNEIELLQGLRHTNIVFFYGWGVWHDGQTFFVTEYCSRGSLRDVLDDDGVAIPPSLGVKFAHDAAKGMAFLHALDPPRLHRDLKADNVLVSEDWTVKLTDFGSARLLGDADDKTEWQLVPSQRPRSPSSSDDPAKAAHGDDEHILIGGSMTAALMSSDVGTLFWLAPEVMSRPNGGFGSSAFAIYGKSADVYSFSIVMYEIMTREMYGNFDTIFGPLFSFFSPIAPPHRPHRPSPGHTLPSASLINCPGRLLLEKSAVLIGC